MKTQDKAVTQKIPKNPMCFYTTNSHLIFGSNISWYAQFSLAAKQLHQWGKGKSSYENFQNNITQNDQMFIENLTALAY